jgi:hypothetical protein
MNLDCLRVAMFPGAIGIDVAKDIDRGIAGLNGCGRLIVDLRGNTGGGIGGLRLMGYLTPGKLEVGYSLTRKRREKGYRREELTRFGRIPSHKATLIWLAARYALVEKSILVVTEGLGPRRFHGRVVLLVNEHTATRHSQRKHLGLRPDSANLSQASLKYTRGFETLEPRWFQSLTAIGPN